MSSPHPHTSYGTWPGCLEGEEFLFWGWQLYYLERNLKSHMCRDHLSLYSISVSVQLGSSDVMLMEIVGKYLEWRGSLGDGWWSYKMLVWTQTKVVCWRNIIARQGMGEWCVVPLDPRVYPAVLCRTHNSNRHSTRGLKHDMFHSMFYFMKIDTNKTMKTLFWSQINELILA